MATDFSLITAKRDLRAKKLLLVDAAGGLLSVILLVLVARFEAYFGMPQQILYTLAVLACLYATYSFCCYLFVKNNRPPYLKLIAVANLLYCCLIVFLLFNFYPQLTTLGFIYFSAEIIVICALAVIELNATGKEL